jgi:chromodomain-helicase-DNA-binding protein 4
MIVQTCCNSSLQEVYTEDERKPEWFEVDRAIACRQKHHINALCDILATFQDNEDYEGYEFLVKWNDLDYCECTWEPYCTEGVSSAISMLIERHQNTLKRVDCISETCMYGILPYEVDNGVLYGYQLQGLKWMFQNFIARRSVILAGMFMSFKAIMHHALVLLTIISIH